MIPARPINDTSGRAVPSNMPNSFCAPWNANSNPAAIRKIA
jgi:hypothetical protein